MTQKQTSILGFVTLAAILAAIWALVGEAPATDDPTGLGEPVIPGLRERLPDVTDLVITKGRDDVTFIRADDGWTLVEKGGYPADTAKVSGLLRGLVQAKTLEAKTVNPDLFPRLGLGEDEALMLTLATALGDPVARITTGRQKPGPAPKTFATWAGTDRAWLIDGIPQLTMDPMDWLDRTAIALAENRIQSVTLADGLGNTYTLGRADQGTATFTLDDLGDGETMIYPAAGNPSAKALTALTFDDVKRADVTGAGALGNITNRATYRTFDGLVIAGAIHEGAWIRLTATYDPATAAAAAPGTIIEDAPRDGALEAAALDARLAPWAYKLPQFRMNDLTKSRADLVTVQAVPD